MTPWRVLLPPTCDGTFPEHIVEAENFNFADGRLHFYNKEVQTTGLVTVALFNDWTAVFRHTPKTPIILKEAING